MNFSDKDFENYVVEEICEAIVYDNVQLSENATDVFRMHPKFMLYDTIDEKAIETEIEKGVMKAR